MGATELIVILFGLAFGLAALRVPVAFALGIGSLVVLFLMDRFPLSVAYVKMVGNVNSWPFVAIPFFLLAGNLMTHGGITTRLVSFAMAVVGWIAGGLGQVAVVVNMIMAGMSGSDLADAAATGSVLIPAMKKAGYPANYAAAIIAAAATMGPIIPPSIAFIIYGAITDLSIGRLFLAGAVPGITMGLILMVACFLVAKRDSWPREPVPTGRELVDSFAKALPALFMPVIIIVGILSGVFTASEASVVAVAYALVVSLYVYRDIHVHHVPAIILDSLKQSAVVLMIIAVAGVFGYVITVLRVADQTIGFITGLTDSPLVLLLLLNILFFIIGCFVDVTASLLIFGPLLVKVVAAYGIDPIHFGVVFVINLQIGLMTPPYGLTMFLLQRIANISMGEYIRAMWPFLTALIVLLMLVTYVPALTLWLPNLVFGGQ
ncbi:MAG: TRAP transporter large permease [Chloroflexi bacterium]|nr:TRAP transporter large permease [Chloroflexota bacterium]